MRPLCPTSPTSRTARIGALLFVVFAINPQGGLAQAPVTYRVSVPEPEHHWMQVEVVFPELGAATLEARMSRSSPGRYALHEFAKNVYDVRAFNGAGIELRAERPNPHGWDVAGHDGTVRFTYKVYGDRVDGTFLAIDTTHAHINIPAALMWARRLESRPVRVTFEPTPGRQWNIATQLHPTEDARTFTAANLQYLMDSPTELSDFTLRTFEVTVPGAPSDGGRNATIRIALHHEGSSADADRFAVDVQRIVEEEAAVFGELPSYEGGAYTFLADFLPSAARDGMEHRNSTVLTSNGALRFPDQRADLISTAAHEFLHGWNVERIRPRSLEPFNLEDTNMSGELWLAEGVTSYYEPLILQRAGLADVSQTLASYARVLDAVIRSPARRYRSAEDVSRLAPFVDAATWTDPTNWDNTYLSYYTWGAAIGLGLDLSLRVRTNGKVTLDDYMRALWQQHGRPGGPAEGLVGRPYTIQDARDRLAEVSGDRAFADEFFDRYIQGREVVDYARLLERAGFILRKRNQGRAWLGPLRLSFDRGSARVVAPAPEGTPAHAAGLDQNDELVTLEGDAMSGSDRLDAVLQKHRPGDRVRATIRRRGSLQGITIVLEEDSRLELVAVDRPLRADERAFRDAWLGSRR